jgi:hypothetical protein
VVEEKDGTLVPSLSLAAVLAYRGAPLQPVVGPKGVQAGGRFVPTEQETQLRLNFAKGLDASRGSPALVSAADVYDGTVNPNRFKDKIVLIGATAESLRDNFDTPVNKSGGTPGVFIHANAINAMLTASYLDMRAIPTSSSGALWRPGHRRAVSPAVALDPRRCSRAGYFVLRRCGSTVSHRDLIYPYLMIVFAFVR